MGNLLKDGGEDKELEGEFFFYARSFKYNISLTVFLFKQVAHAKFIHITFSKISNNNTSHWVSAR